MDSTTVMIERLSGLLGTKDLSEREQGFVSALKQRVDAGQVTRLTEKQLDWLVDLHRKHFA